MKQYWYNQLLAIPKEKESKEYIRLKRIWKDRTRFHGKKESAARYHEICNPNHETNLTVSLWENFTLFDGNDWINQLLIKSGLEINKLEIIDCNWSYEWEKREGGKIKLTDV